MKIRIMDWNGLMFGGLILNCNFAKRTDRQGLEWQLVAGAPECLLVNGCDRRKHTDCLQTPERDKTTIT